MNHVPQTATKTSSLLVAVVAPLLVFALGACDGASSPGDGAKASGGAAAEACDPVTGTGGGIYLPNCRSWLGLRDQGVVDPMAPLLVDCPAEGEPGEGGSSGEGGASAGSPPPLRTLCEAPSMPDLNHAHNVYHCVKKLLNDPCAPESAELLEACVTQPIPCVVEPVRYGCSELMDTCPELTAGTCYWAMAAARNRDAIRDCFAEARPSESCSDRFLRCAWQL